MIKHFVKAMVLGSAVVSASFAVTDIPFSDLPVLDSATNPTATIGPDKNWRVRGIYKIPSGCVLTVKPGTWVFGTGMPSLSYFPSSIVVVRGGKLIAEGKPDSTIVFTAIGDDKNDPSALGPGTKGLWGGITILGRAPVSTMRTDTAGNVIYPYSEALPPGDLDYYFGGNNPEDSSGVLKYVSVRHGGYRIPMGPEILSISFCGVGSKTVVDHVESFAGYDDGFAFYGGTVNCKHLISAFNCDDHFDFDDGYNGKCQFLFSIASEYEGARGCEFDGKQKRDQFTSAPKFYNVTLIGSGKKSANNADDQNFGNAYLFAAADSLGGSFNDMIVMDGPVAAAKAWSHKTSGPLPLQNGLEMKSNIFFNFGLDTSANPWRALFRTTSSSVAPVDTNYWFKPGREINNPLYKNGIADPKLNGVSRECFSAMLDPRPRLGSVALNPQYATTPPNDGFFTQTNYIGAFDASNLWTNGWSKLSAAAIQTPLLKITLANEELVWTGGFFYIRTLVKIPDANIVNSSITINGVTVDPALFARTVLPESHFVSDGFRVSGYAVRDLYTPTGATYANGAPNNSYLVKAVYTLSDGTVLKDSTTWKISN